MAAFVPNMRPGMVNDASLLRYRAKRNLRLRGRDFAAGEDIPQDLINDLGKHKVELLLSTLHIRMVPLDEVTGEVSKPTPKPTPPAPHPIPSPAPKPTQPPAPAPLPRTTAAAIPRAPKTVSTQKLKQTSKSK